jgi:hypothetical protein
LDLETVIQKLLDLAVQNAGAERGALKLRDRRRPAADRDGARQGRQRRSPGRIGSEGTSGTK